MDGLLCGKPKTSLFGCELFCRYLISFLVLSSAVLFVLVQKHHYSRKKQEEDLFCAWSPCWFLPKKKRTGWTKGRNYCLDKVTWQVNRSSGWVSVPKGTAPSKESWASLSVPNMVKTPWNWGRTGHTTALWGTSISQKEWSNIKINRDLIDWASWVKYTVYVLAKREEGIACQNSLLVHEQFEQTEKEWIVQGCRATRCHERASAGGETENEYKGKTWKR